MINVIVWPLVILMIILLIIYTRKNMHKIMKPKIRRWLLISYVSILLIATILFFIIQPINKIAKAEIEQPPYLYDLVNSKDVIQLLEPYKQNEWDIKIKDGEIKLDTIYKGYWVDVYVPVVVVEEEEKIDTASITYYETPTVFNNIDISTYIDTANVKVMDGNITIEFQAVEREYLFQEIRKDMVLYQFKKDTINNINLDVHFGEMAIALHVPKGTSVVADLEHFDIIRK